MHYNERAISFDRSTPIATSHYICLFPAAMVVISLHDRLSRVYFQEYLAFVLFFIQQVKNQFFTLKSEIGLTISFFFILFVHAILVDCINKVLQFNIKF